VVGYYTCFDGRILGSSICVSDSFDAITEEVAKIAASLAIGFPKDTRFSQPVQVVLSRGLSTALNVEPGELSYFSSSADNANTSRRLREGTCQDADIVHRVSYEVVAPSLRKQETFEAAQNVVVAGTEAYSRLSSVLSAMSGGGQIEPCTEELLAPVLFMDQIVRMKNGSIVLMSQAPSEAAVAAAADDYDDASANGVDDEGLESGVILSCSLGGVGLICSICLTLFIRNHLKKRQEQDLSHAPSNNSLFPTTSTAIGKQIPKSPRQASLPVLLTGLASSSEGKQRDTFECAKAPSGGISWKQATPDVVGYDEV
jgi:hypothetical protein